jgi:hypothetical protein
MENRKRILGIKRNVVVLAHKIMLVTILHSSFIASSQTMIIDYFNTTTPLRYKGSSLINYTSSNNSSIPSQPVALSNNSIPNTRYFTNQNSAKIVEPKIDFSNYVVSSDIKQGLIGVTKEHPLDDVSDNLFKFYLNQLPQSQAKIYISYELFGVQDVNAVSRSINERLATGGYIVKQQLGWSIQKEEINKDWLRQGENKIMFSIPKGADYQYQIKNLKIEVETVKENAVLPKLVLNSPVISFIKDNQLYVKGFIRDTFSMDTKVYIEDQLLTFKEGEFEGFITLTEALKSRKFVVIKAQDSKGLIGQELLSFDILNEADKLFPIETTSDKVYSIFKANQKSTLQTDGASITIKDSALSVDKELNIIRLRAIDIAPMGSGMINVTRGGYGYRFLPDGTTFQKPVSIAIGYDEKLLPSGYTPKDIKTFYFNTNSKSWVAIERDTINEKDKIISAWTTHFTDYINGIIQSPESPETAGFTPTMMNDIKAADPSSEMTIMSPPEVSQKGDANVSYPIKIPAGRKGMQPQIAVQYSNEGGNGWLGQGWNLTIPAITIDTRWGVPLLDPINESEIYSLGGEQLMYPKMESTVAGQSAVDWMPNRHHEVVTAGDTSVDPKLSTTPQLRTYQLVNNVKMFTPRKQGSFARIERLGTDTKSYYWKVTSTDGTINWYGGKMASDITTGNAVIKNAGGDIVHWGLFMTEDVYGNNVKYEYVNDTIADANLSESNMNLKGGIIFQIKTIYYTGTNNDLGKYQVQFNTNKPTEALPTSLRNDITINARLGVKQIEPYLLDNIIVKEVNPDKNIRKYQFNYGQGKFLKSRLTSIYEYDSNFASTDPNNPPKFNTHKFEYYNDITSEGVDTYFSSGVEQAICTEETTPPCPDIDNDGICDKDDTCLPPCPDIDHDGTQDGTVCTTPISQSNNLFSQTLGTGIVQITYNDTSKKSVTIKKTNGVDSWNAGASSKIVLTEGNYLEYTLDRTSCRVMVGLSKWDKDASYTSLNYALYANLGSVGVYENGDSRPTLATVSFTTASKFKIAIQGGKIKFYCSGILVYESKYVLINPKFVVDTSILTLNSQILNLQVFKCCDGNDSDGDGVCDLEEICIGENDLKDDNMNGIPDDCEGPCNPKSKPFKITNAIGIGQVVENGLPTIIKTTQSYFWNSGGSTNISLSEGDYITYKVIPNQPVMVGLSENDKDSSYKNIDYAIYVDYDNYFKIYEKGIQQLTTENNHYYAGDIIKILIEEGKVKYFCNNKLIYVSLQSLPSLKLVVDFSIFTPLAKIIDFKIWKCCVDSDNDGVCDTVDQCPGKDDKIDINQNGLPDDCDATCTLKSESYSLVKSSGVSQVFTSTGNTITKTAGKATQWDQGGSTNISLSEGNYIRYKALIAKNVIVGLSDNDTSVNYSSINYALFHAGTSTTNFLYVYENGIRKQNYSDSYNGNLGSYTNSSVFKIMFEYGGKIKYYCDDILIHVSNITTPAGVPLPKELVVDFSMYDIGSQIIDLQIFKCCPDADGDGVCDIDDRCPTQPGTLASNGCPSCAQYIKSIGDNETKKYTIDVGTATGTVRLDYIGFENPDKFEMSWNGATKGSPAYNSSGYVGREDYFHNGSTINAHQTLLNLGIPEAEIKLSTQKTPTYYGQGNMSIYKASSYPTTVDVFVKPGLGLSQGDFTLNCPYKSEYNCNNQVVSNGVTGSFTYKVDVGTATGTIQLNYNAFNLPDKFEMSWNGALDGSPSYNSSGYRGLFTNQSQQQLINLGIPLSDIHLENPSIGSGTIFINKTAANPTTVEVTVTAPISNTGWNFSVVCPSLPSAAGKPNRNSMITSSVSTERIKCYTVHFPLPKKKNQNDSFTTEIKINDIPLNAEGKNYDLTSTTTNGSSYSLTDFISHLTQTFGTKVSIIDNEVTLTVLNVYMGFETITLQSSNGETNTYSYTELDCNNTNRKTINSETLKSPIATTKSILPTLIKDNELTKKAEQLIDKSTTASNLSTAPVSQTRELKKSSKLANTAMPSGSTYKTFFSQIREQVMSQYSFSFASAVNDPNTGCGSKLNLDFLIQGDIPSFDSAASSLGSSITESKSTGFYIGVGVGRSRKTKMTTFGVQFNWGNDRSEGMTALIDINGDGLDDIVTKENDDRLTYKKHVITLTYDDKNEPVRTHSFESKRPITGINNFYRSYGRSNSRNFQVTYGLKRINGFVGWDKSSSKSETDIYFTDGNGDGLMDIVRDGVVYFNRLDPNGDPNYIADSEGTENLVITAAERTVDVPDDYNEETNTFPAFDVVKVWEAPADGEIQIDNTITLTDTTKEAVATIEMKNSVAPVTKCYEVSFPVPRAITSRYNYYFPGGWISSGRIYCQPFSSRYKSFTINNITYVPNKNLCPSFYQNDNFTNLCPDILNTSFPSTVIQNTSFVTDFSNWFENTLLLSGNPITNLQLNNISAIYNISPYYNVHSVITGGFDSTNRFEFLVAVDYTYEGLYFSEPIIHDIQPVETFYNISIPITISVNTNPLQGNPFSLYDNFSQFKVAFEAQYPDSEVTSSNNVVTIKINNTTDTFTNITLTPTNGSSANTYTFTEVSCTNASRLSAGKTNQKTSKDDWKDYKPSKEEIEVAIKKWDAEGKGMNEPIAENFPMNYIIDATNNAVNKSVSGTYLYTKDNSKTSWKNAKGIIIKDKKTISILNQLLPADMEKVYATFKEKSKQETIERRKKSQIEAQAWLEDYNKKQEEKNNKNATNRLANPTSNALTYNTTTCASTPGDLSLLYGKTLNSSTTTVTNSLTTNTAGQNLYVKKGDRIYFRVHSVANGNPPVNWDPKVSYTNPDVLATTDANGATPFSSSYSDGFVLSSILPLQFPGNSGFAAISWDSIQVNNPSDKVTFEIIKKEVASASESDTDEEPATVSEVPIYKWECLPGQNNTVSPTISSSTTDLSNVSITDISSNPNANLSQTEFYFKISATSNVDWKNIQWRPKVVCTVKNQKIKPSGDSGPSEGTVTTTQTMYPVPDYSLYRPYPCGPAYNKLNVASLNLGQGSYIAPSLNGLFSAGDAGKINFVVKSGTRFIGSSTLTIGNNSNFTNIPINPNDITDSQLELSYTIDDSQNENESSLLSKIALSTTTLATIYNGTTSTPVSKNNINLYQKPIQNFGSFYKQWGQFLYNPKAVEPIPSSIPNISLIKEQALVIDESKLQGISEAVTNVEANGDSMTEQQLQSFQAANEGTINSIAVFTANPSREYSISTSSFIDRWIGMHPENYASEFASRAATMQQSFDSMESFEPNTEQAVLKTGAIAISKYAKGNSNNFSGGIGFSIIGANRSKTNNGISYSLTDYIDYNGDRYPDIVSSDKVQYTTKTGGLFNDVSSAYGRMSESWNVTDGFGASGSFSKGDDSGNKDSNSASKGNNNSVDKGGFEGFKGNAGAGISGSFTTGSNVTKRAYADINGDGLSDLILVDNNDNTQVQLNTGKKSLESGYTVQNLPVSKSNSEGVSAGLGINKWSGSAEAGVSLTTSWNSSTNTLIDINGDGLVDLINSNTNSSTDFSQSLGVQLNLGNKFQNNGSWSSYYNLNRESASVSTNLNFGVTFAFVWRFFGLAFKIPALNFNGSPYGSSTNNTKKSISDFDGDGYPDLIEEVSRSKVKVYSSKIRRTDMLKKVINPLGGSFVIDYKVQPVSYGNPHAKWAMSSIEVNDGYNKSNDGQDTYRKEFVYEDGKYDRREREFYGYKKSKSNRL